MDPQRTVRLEVDQPNEFAGLFSQRVAMQVLGRRLQHPIERQRHETRVPDGRAITSLPPPSNKATSFSGRFNGTEIFGISVPVVIAGQKLWVEVAQDLAHRDVLIDDIVADFFIRVGWITAPILLLLLVIDVVIIRRALRPVIVASNLAQRIGPAHTDLRLPEPAMPREVRPLVHAVNQALDRLEEGFRGQREFTADAAHELRTPLAILRTQIDMIADPELAKSLRHDVENMSRLVNQLLEMAELDTFVIGPGETADLAEVAAEVAAFLAPLALADEKRVAVTGARRPVVVPGNPDMLGRAVRNLVENALVHTPRATTVEIEIDPGGAISISTVVARGVWTSAFSTRLRTARPSMSGLPGTTTGRRAPVTATRFSSASASGARNAATSAATSARSAVSPGPMTNVSSSAISSSWLTSRLIFSTSWRSDFASSGSAIMSICVRRIASGVRNSCAASAVNSR